MKKECYLEVRIKKTKEKGKCVLFFKTFTIYSEYNETVCLTSIHGQHSVISKQSRDELLIFSE